MIPIETRSCIAYFASMLAYPDRSLPETAADCANLLDPADPAAPLIRGFAAYAAGSTLATLEEAYTSVFDLEPKCAPYIGYHVFGESYKRSVFLLGLNERFGAQRFTPPGELPDHLAVVLSCLVACQDDELAQELIAEAVLPALDRMTGRAKSVDADETTEDQQSAEEAAAQRAPFVDLLEALRLVLREAAGDAIAEEAVVSASGSSFLPGGPTDG